MTNQARSHIFTVSKLNRFAKHILESEIGQIWISAEISNFVAAASGHWYFTLKDERAQIKAAMFRNSNRFGKFKPKNGDKILVRGNISLYEPRGDFQLIVSHMEPEGEGLLKQQYEFIKQKLANEGLFAPVHKQPIPENPKTVGVITSSTGAAWHDIVTVLRRRNPSINIVLYPSQVQGEGSEQQLLKALHIANQRNEVDVLILGRGGGSMEDLWSFNDEQLARAIFQSSIPVISAVGHEIDFTIADFVADARAPTPSAAAELASAPLHHTLERLHKLMQRIQECSLSHLQHAQYRYRIAKQQLQSNHPRSQLLQQQQLLDNLSLNLSKLWQDNLMRKTVALEKQHSRLNQMHPKHQLAGYHQRIQYLSDKLLGSMNNRLQARQQKLGQVAQLLDTVSPLATLARGYTLTYKNDQIAKKAANLSVGDTISTRFKDGDVISTIKSISVT